MARRENRADYLIPYLIQISEDIEMKYAKRLADYTGQTEAQVSSELLGIAVEN